MSPDFGKSQRLHDLVEAFAQTAQAVVDLGRSCGTEEFARPTDCPGWTVHDQISHVAGVEAWLGGRKDPRVEMPHYEHIRNDLGKKVEYAVQVRRERTGAQVVAELDAVLEQRLTTLRDPDLTASTTIAGPFGPDQAGTVLLLRTFDVWTHEQDIRSALGRPGNLDSPAAAVCVGSIMGELPRLLARGARVEPGQAVVIEVGGPGSVAARQGFLVETDEQGRARGRAVSGEQPASSTTTISLTTEAFTRRAAGRRSVSDTAYEVSGDGGVARRVLEALVVTH